MVSCCIASELFVRQPSRLGYPLFNISTALPLAWNSPKTVSWPGPLVIKRGNGKSGFPNHVWLPILLIINARDIQMMPPFYHRDRWITKLIPILADWSYFVHHVCCLKPDVEPCFVDASQSASMPPIWRPHWEISPWAAAGQGTSMRSMRSALLESSQCAGPNSNWGWCMAWALPH